MSVVRSVLRERSNARFAAPSAAFHAALVVAAAVWLPLPYRVVALFLAARAVAPPIARRRLAVSPRPLRPVQVGMVEMVASLAVLIVGFAARV